MAGPSGPTAEPGVAAKVAPGRPGALSPSRRAQRGRRHPPPATANGPCHRTPRRRLRGASMLFAATLFGSLMVLGALATQFQAVQEARTGKALAIAQMARDEGFLLHHWLHEYRASEGSTREGSGTVYSGPEPRRTGLDPLSEGIARPLTPGERTRSGVLLDVDEQGFDRYAEIRMPLRREIGGWEVEHALLALPAGNGVPFASIYGIVVVQPPGTAATAAEHDQAIRDEVARELEDSLFAPGSVDWGYAQEAVSSLEEDWDFAFWAWRFAGIDEGNLLRDPRSGFPNWNQMDGDLTVRGDTTAVVESADSVVARGLAFPQLRWRNSAAVVIENIAASDGLHATRLSLPRTTDPLAPRRRIAARDGLRVTTEMRTTGARLEALRVDSDSAEAGTLEDVDVLVVATRYRGAPQ